MKLFCFPYAGGSAYVYNEWKHYLANDIELYPVELAGRGKRFREKHYTGLSDAINDLYGIIERDIDQSTYAFYGHSMGCQLAYYLAQKIGLAKKNGPEHIFFSGMYPPYARKEDKIIHNLPDHEFITEISKLGGMPSELLQDNSLLEVFIPILKSDYKMVECCDLTELLELDKNRLSCDITVLSGKYDEEVTQEDIILWEKCTTGHFDSYLLEGGHFFIRNNSTVIADIINSKLVRRLNLMT